MQIEIDYLRLTTAVAIALFIHLYMYVIFVERPRKFDPNSAASYFEINQILSRGRLHAIAAVYAIPLTASVAVLTFVAKSIFSSLRMTAIEYLPEFLKGKGFSPGLIKSVQNAISQIPEQGDPIVVSVLALIFLYPHFRIVTSLYRNRAIKTLEVEETIDSLALKAAKNLLSNSVYHEIYDKLRNKYGSKIPSPPDLINRTDQELLAYQLLYLAKDYAAEIGTANALSKVVNDLESKKITLPQLPAIEITTLIAGAIWYIILCALYTGIVPFFSPLADRFSLGWPERGREIQLFISILQNVFMFSIPVLFGQYTVSSRIARGNSKPRSLSKFLVSALLPFGISMTVGISFLVLMLQLKSDNAPIQFLNTPLYEDQTVSRPLWIGSYAVWFYTLSASLVPIVIIFAWERLTLKALLQNKDFISRNIIFVVLSSFGFALSQLFFELRHRMDYYFYHQAILGAFLSAILLLAFPAAQATRKRLSIRRSNLGDRP